VSLIHSLASFMAKRVLSYIYRIRKRLGMNRPVCGREEIKRED